MAETVPAPRYTTYVPLTDLAPAPGNPKKHEVERIIESIHTHGFVDQPIADERTGTILGGHGRREALIEMQTRGERLPAGLLLDNDGGWLVPVQRGWASRSDAEAKALNIKLNKIGADGGWRPRALAAYLEDIVTADAELFDSLAIPEDELESLLRRVDPESLPGAINEDQAVLHLPDDGGDGLGGEKRPRPDDEGRAPLTTCPACGHAFTPSR
ncbi:ParB N-terminal domain-containing protein [Streptomyces rhizosphaericus]|uniref:ParB N-terminal domain-containing protein n=1 Tax=Streptomyces rhizosphaericus TaxID=114699 RepID=A0A6G4AKL3_9ACTN|nr:ParB N-terminal domain-containing protein [Streptomyces rhizosphaericus]NEW73782.1 ParB N-terminal domain-containing protein [Streptomyces rhizosphaericus]